MAFRLLLWFCSLQSIINPAVSSGLEQLVITVLSQDHPYHIQQAVSSKALLLNDCNVNNISAPVIHLAQEDFPYLHSWTIFPLLPVLLEQHGHNASWFLFGPENMDIHPEEMVSLLSNFSPEQEVFLGRALRDSEATITHHFAFYEDPSQFAFPDISAGVLLSSALLFTLVGRYSRSTAAPVDFSIDPAYELALYVWRDGAGVTLTDTAALCAGAAAAGCATSQRTPPSCGEALDPSTVHFAVKTCAKFHQSRLPVVQATWAPDARHVRYYSDVPDERFGTVSVGVANTKRGHCAKTMAIVRRSAALSGLRWLVVVDDDTLLSVPRLLELLACYSADLPLMLGERYGFHTSGSNGYSYITGGGGMVLSAEAVRSLAVSCRCPQPDTPDDMQLGLCAAADAGITLLHSPRFHQARPADYPAALLANSRPVSFHKHWMVDPYRVYSDWLRPGMPETLTKQPVSTQPDEKGPTQSDGRAPTQPDGRGPTQQEGRVPTQPDGRGPTQQEGRGPTQPDGRGPTPQEVPVLANGHTEL